MSTHSNSNFEDGDLSPLTCELIIYGQQFFFFFFSFCLAEFSDSVIRRDEGSIDAPVATAFVTATVAGDDADAEKVDPMEDPPKSRNTSADAMDTEDECPIDMMVSRSIIFFFLVEGSV